MDNVLIAFAPAIAGIISAWVGILSWYESTRKTKHDELHDLYDEVKSDNDRLRRENNRLRKEKNRQ